MWIKQIHICNFRNIENLTLTLHPGMHYFIGSNGQGKTSILEAIGYLSLLSSFRGASSEELWKSGAEEKMSLQCLLEDEKDNSIQTVLQVHWNKTEYPAEKIEKSFLVNGKKYGHRYQYLLSRLRNPLIGFQTVIFNPGDQDILRGSPQHRRDYLDAVIATWDPAYLQALRHYQRALLHRNALLKNGMQNSKAVELSLTEAFVQYGVYLTYQRLRWVQTIREKLQENWVKIANNSTQIQTRFFSNWAPFTQGVTEPQKHLKIPDFSGLSDLPSLEILERAFWQKLEELRVAEYHQGTTLVGPHRDDWGVYLGNHLIQNFGSQGEVRSILLALKLSEIDLIKKKTGRNPIFLLDDLSSELDRDRRAFLLDTLLSLKLQVFVTSTEPLRTTEEFFEVSGGAIFNGRTA